MLGGVREVEQASSRYSTKGIETDVKDVEASPCGFVVEFRNATRVATSTRSS